VLGHAVDAAGGLPSDGSGHNTTAGAALYATGAAALGAVAGQAAGGNAQSGANTAINAATNNYLTHNQIVRKQQDLAQAVTPEQKQQITDQYAALDKAQQQGAGSQQLGTLLGVRQGLGTPIPGCSVPTNCAADVQQSQQDINGAVVLNGGATLPDNGTTLAVISTLGGGPLVRGASAIYNAASNWLGGTSATDSGAMETAYSIKGGISMSDILLPNGEPVGYIFPGSGPGIRTVASEQFDQLQSELLNGATPIATPSRYTGAWYQMPDGSVFGIRTSTGNGTTIDVIKSENPSLPSGFKVHQK
jgi:hypothetical protein